MIDFCILGSGISGSTIANYYLKNIQLKFLIKQEVQVVDLQIRDLRVI